MNNKTKLIMAVMESATREQLLEKIGEILEVKLTEVKPIVIDKPGVYEDEEGNKILFSDIEPDQNGHLYGFDFEQDFARVYFKSGKAIDNEPSISKFLSTTYNFEKGEPT